MRFFPDLRDYKPLLYLYSILCNFAGIGAVTAITAFEEYTLKVLLQDKTFIACLLLLSVDLPILLLFKYSAEKLNYKFFSIVKQYMIFIVIKAVLLALYIIYMHKLTVIMIIFLVTSFGTWIFLGIEAAIILVVIIVNLCNIKRVL
jgi:hypothetical protein